MEWELAQPLLSNCSQAKPWGVGAQLVKALAEQERTSAFSIPTQRARHGGMAHAFNPRAGEVETGGCLALPG